MESKAAQTILRQQATLLAPALAHQGRVYCNMPARTAPRRTVKRTSRCGQLLTVLEGFTALTVLLFALGHGS